MLYTSLKLALNSKYTQSSFVDINMLDDFLKFDEEQKLLDVSSFDSVSLIACIYTAESMKNKHRANYWLSYMQSLAFDLPEEH